MSTTSKLSIAHAVFTTLAVCAAAALAYRIWRASDFGTLEALTSAGTGALVAAACSAGWLIRVRKVRARAEAAELKVVHMRDAVLDDEEDKALWDSIPPAKIDEDTCAFGLNVVVLNQRRFPRAG